MDDDGSLDQGAQDVSPGAQSEAQPRRGLWGWLREKTNPALYRPRPADGVTFSRLQGREGIYYVLRSPDASSYLKLTDRDYYIWTQMDGQRTVKDLVVAYFMEFGAFALDRVRLLVRELRQGGFLVDRHLDVLAHIDAELAGRQLTSWGTRLTSAFLHHEILIPGIDGFLDRLYRYSFWLFSWPVQLFFVVVILTGLGLFTVTYAEGDIPLLTVGESYWLGLVALLAINAGLIISHEFAHGLATKHFGRRVRRGGFLIYYGYPAFFVDTMDMWLEGRRARILVSWAGLHSGLFIGGLCALLVRVFPTSAVAPWLFKTAFVAYVTAFFNLNPLLELDGYLILIDLLEIPMLRKRAFRFVRHQLLDELRAVWRKWRQSVPNWRADFTREERLLALFGLLAAAYTAYSIWFIAVFWQTQVVAALRELWNRPGWLSKLLLILVLGIVVVPVGAALLTQILALGRRGWIWLEERRFFSNGRNVNLSLLAILALVTLCPVLVADPWWSRYLAVMPPLLLVLGIAALIRTGLRYRGAEFQNVFWALAASVGILALAAILRAFLPSEDTPAATVYDIERLAALPLSLAGVFGLSGVDLRRGTLWERVAVVVLILAAGLVTVPVARWTREASLYRAVLAVAAPYLTLIFLATAIPNLATFSRTRFGVAWLVLISAAVVTGGVNLLRASPESPAPTSDMDRWLALFQASFWALGAALYDLASQRARFEPPEWAVVQVISEEKRLRHAFARFFAGLFDAFRENFGVRRAQVIDDALDVLAVTADWEIEIDGGRVRDELDLDRMTLWEQADRYREVLARTIELMDRYSGRSFVLRAAQAASDSLPWPDRESLGHYVLTGTDWGAGIATQFASHRDDRWRLVRALPLFAHCGERALELIVATLESQHVPMGRVLAHQNTPVERFIVVQSGEVEKWRKDDGSTGFQMVGELRRGASFGDQAFFGLGCYEATYRTSVPSEVLILDTPACERLLRSGVALATRVGASLEVVRLLSGMPLFSHLSSQQLSNLASRMRRRSTSGSEILAHRGTLGHSLFIVAEGVVEALAEDNNGETIVAHVHTPGEHFGAFALFCDTPYQFTYRTRGPATLVTLDETIFDALVAQSERMATYVEQVGSGRLLLKRSGK